MNNQSPKPTPLFGTLTRAGTFPIRDEETTGLVISMSREDLAAIAHIPMYERVAVLPAEIVDELPGHHTQPIPPISDSASIWEASFDAYCNGQGDKSAHERAAAIIQRAFDTREAEWHRLAILVLKAERTIHGFAKLRGEMVKIATKIEAARMPPDGK